MSHVSLTPLNPADFAAVGALARTIWLAHYTSIITTEQIEYMLEGRFTPDNLQRYIDATDRWLYVLRLDAEPIGYCSCSLTTTPREMKLEQLYVLPALHGQGHGRRMLDAVVAKALELHCDTLMLQVNKRNTNAIDVYRRTGFTVRSEVVIDIGRGYVMDDFIMERRI